MKTMQEILCTKLLTETHNTSRSDYKTFLQFSFREADVIRQQITQPMDLVAFENIYTEVVTCFKFHSRKSRWNNTPCHN